MKQTLITSLILAMLTLSLPAAAQGSESQPEPLRGLRMGVIGDSYVRNHRKPVEETWHYKFARKHGMEYLNYGRNGCCVSMDRERFGPALYKRYTEMADSLDLIVVIAGHNDAVLLDSMGIDTYRQRLNELCQGLIQRYPTARILWFTPWSNDNPNFLKVVDATLEVCGSWSIPVFDAYRRGNIYARDDQFRSVYFQGGGKADRAHLNAQGHDRFLTVAEKFILNAF